MLEVAGDFFLADPDAGREFTSGERALPEYLPERRPYRFVSLDDLVWAWPFRQRVHLGSMGSCGSGPTITQTHSRRLTPPSR